LTGYSKLKKAELKALLGMAVVTKKTYNVNELRKMCKERGVKGYSKLKKKELQKLLFTDGFSKQKRIEEMKKKTEQHFDPIYGEPFQEWTDYDLEHAIFLGHHFYQPKFLLEYVQKKYAEGITVIKDPMTNQILSQKIIEGIFKENGKAVEKPKIFHFDTALMQLSVDVSLNQQPLLPKDRSRWNFVEVVLQYNASQIKISGGGRRLTSNRILIANIPMGISINPEGNEVKSLDAATTSEAILVNITSLVRNGKIFVMENNRKYRIKSCSIFQTRSNYWLTTGPRNRRRVDTTSTDGPYMKMIEKIQELMS
jgi:hypothetical protein